MIVPMKKVFLVLLEAEKRQALKSLRKLGLVHLEELEGHSEELSLLKGQQSNLETALRLLQDLKLDKTVKASNPLEESDAMIFADQVISLFDEKTKAQNEIIRDQLELDRLSRWGGINLEDFAYLSEKGVHLHLYEIPANKYATLPEDIETVFVNQDKNTARFLLFTKDENLPTLPAEAFAVAMPEKSTSAMKQNISDLNAKIAKIDSTLLATTSKINFLKDAIKAKVKQVEFENAFSGMSCDNGENHALAWLTGYVPTENAEEVKKLAEAEKWGFAAVDPEADDPVPTKIKNNKLVSLIYPVTDFLGTVPGYTEYDISNWFLLFFCIFFGMIFGDGGYGLILVVAALGGLFSAIFKGKKPASAMFLLLLIGLATVGWGMVTCSWFGIDTNLLPDWLKNLSVPALSNVTANISSEMDTYVSQNIQIFCFTLALIQLSIAHLKGIVRYIKSLKALGELGSLVMLWGIYLVVLNMVVSSVRFPMPSYTIPLVLGGFLLNFIFGNYDGNFGAGLAESAKNIVSLLLGVVNVFSDVVSYIRLWAVGLAGGAIASTVNEMAGPMMGGAIICAAILLLFFGHGLNMILNVLSVIVHGVRLNTLEFSNHLGMSWAGFSYKPFSEKE